MLNRDFGLTATLKQEAWLSYLFVFIVSFGVFLVLQATPTFADPDSFYHAKMAILIRDAGGPVSDFPWLRLTVLGEHYTDQHFLYHVLLIPFVTWFPPLVGLKLATVLFGASLITTAYWLMRQFNVRGAIIFALLLLLIRPFTFRVSLAKVPSTSLIFMFLGLAWMWRYKFKHIFALAFGYVWYYGGFPLLGVAAVVYTAVSLGLNKLSNRVHGHQYLRKVLSLVRRGLSHAAHRHPNRRLLGVVLAGLSAGVVINPYFPGNIIFYYHQLVNIGIINFQKVIGVGSEWYPYKFTDLAANGAIASLLLLSVLGLLWRWRAQSKQTWTLFALTVFFFLLTLKSRRYVEYYIPFAVLFSAFSISDTLGGSRHLAIVKELRAIFWQTKWAKMLAATLVVYLLFGFGYVIGRDFRNERQELMSGFALNKWQTASYWLILNTPVGSRVVHSDWDEFPVLFYHNTHNTYIAGLDPTFLYKADQDVYWTWVNITLGRFDGNLYQAVTEKLGSRYVFVAAGHQVMDNLFKHNPDFTLRYSDDEARVYEARPGR